MANNRLLNFGYMSLAGLLLWPFLMFVGPGIEARFAPKMKYPAEITRVEQDTQFSALIWGETERLESWWRTCNFSGVEWYLGKRNGRATAVTVEFLEKPKTRPDGHMEFGPWRVRVPAEQLKTETFADAVHQCEWFGFIPAPWKLRSPFY